MTREVIIENMTIRLPNGWRGDASYLARAIADQLQKQAGELSSTQSLSLKVQGHFGGAGNRVAESFSRQLTVALASARRGGGK